MKDIECKNCGKKYKLKISETSFRKNGVFIYDENAEKYEGKTWNIYRCECGVEIEMNYRETNISPNVIDTGSGGAVCRRPNDRAGSEPVSSVMRSVAERDRAA